MAKEKEIKMDKLTEKLMEWVNKKEEPITNDEKVLKLAREMTGVYKELGKAYEDDYENNIFGLLSEDDHLLEELTDKLSMANLMELDEETDMEQAEAVYLSLMDTCFESAKILNPMAGFGRDRLEAGLGILHSFEKEYWPLITRITTQNARSFYNLIPDEHYDDILVGRKRAIGAVKLENSRITTAGVAVYSIDEGLETFLHINWIYVAEDYRQHGLGNLLMAKLLEIALAYNYCTLDLDLNMPDTSKEEVQQSFDVLENFLDSWKFGFEISTGEDFFVRVSDKENNIFLKGTISGVASVSELGADAEKLIEKFFDKLESDRDEPVRETSLAFWDPDVSCAVVQDGELKALLLLHRFENSDYRYEALRLLPDCDIETVRKLVRYAYRAILRKGDTESIVFGDFDSTAGFDMAKEIFPAARTMYKFHGELTAPMPEDVITSEQWDVLRQKAGFSDDKLPEGEPSEEDFSKEKMEKLATLFKIRY